MKQPTFSICIPNYNYEGFVGKTIESVLAQTYPHFEIIVVDNSSTDKSFEVASSYNDPRVRVYRNNYNIGFAPNLQIATSYARNDFINLLSSDDIMKPNALEVYAKIIHDNEEHFDSLILASDNEVIDGNNKITGFRYFNQTNAKAYWSYDGEYERYLETLRSNQGIYNGIDLLKLLAPELNTLAGFLSIVYSRKLWDKVGGYNAVRSIGPDKYFNYKLLLQQPHVIYVNQPLYSYRFHQSSNIKAYYSTIKQQVDDYLNVLEFADLFQDQLGIDKEQLIRNYLKRFCFAFSLSGIKRGRFKSAVKAFFFALASFPETAIKLRMFYINILALLFSPAVAMYFWAFSLFKKHDK